MSFIHYLMLGAFAYGSGFALRHYVFGNQQNRSKAYQATFAFFMIMLPIAWAINNWILQKNPPDFAFIIVSSLVATFIFYQGIAVDKNHQVPD